MVMINILFYCCEVLKVAILYALNLLHSQRLESLLYMQFFIYKGSLVGHIYFRNIECLATLGVWLCSSD